MQIKSKPRNMDKDLDKELDSLLSTVVWIIANAFTIRPSWFLMGMWIVVAVFKD